MDDGTMVINGRKLNKEINLPEFMDLFPEFQKDGWKISPGNYVCCAKRCECLGNFFTITVRFQRKRINQVRLYPEMPDKKSARKACEAWLSKVLGSPHEQSPDSTLYEYEWGMVQTEEDRSMEPECSIVIDFH